MTLDAAKWNGTGGELSSCVIHTSIRSCIIFTLFIISVLALGHYLCEKYYMNIVSATSGRLML